MLLHVGVVQTHWLVSAMSDVVRQILKVVLHTLHIQGEQVSDLHELLSELTRQCATEARLMARNVDEALADKEGRAASNNDAGTAGKEAGTNGSD